MTATKEPTALSNSNEERLSRVEAEVASLAASVAQTSKNVDKLGDQMREGFENLRVRTAPDMKIILGVGALIMSISSLVFTAVYRDIGRNEAVIDRLRDEVLGHVRDGHPARIEQLVGRNFDGVEDATVAIHGFAEWQLEQAARHAEFATRLEVIERRLAEQGPSGD